MKMGKRLIQFVRNDKGVPIGCFVGFDKNNIGWSLCNKKDKWDRKKAKEIASGRAVLGSSTPVPKSIYGDWLKFCERCEKYFK